MLADILKGKPMQPDEADSSAEVEKPMPPPADADAGKVRPREIGGPKGPEPTRYRDWERGGRCIDF